MALTNVRLKMVYSTHVLVHTDVPPTEAEWKANLSMLTENRTAIKGILVYTKGGGPSALQRAEYNQTIEKAGMKGLKVAILNGSVMVRGIVTAFNWFQGNAMRMFPLTAIEDACEYLGLSSMEAGAVATELQKLKTELKI